TGEVRPGQTYTFNFQMTAPGAGSFTTDWRMVRDGVAWFGPTLSKIVNVIPTGPDNGPPTTPTNLVGFATTANSVQLDWTASIDDTGVLGYDVRRDGQIIGNAPSNTYLDNTAAPNTTYTYEVRARDGVPSVS